MAKITLVEPAPSNGEGVHTRIKSQPTQQRQGEGIATVSDPTTQGKTRPEPSAPTQQQLHRDHNPKQST